MNETYGYSFTWRRWTYGVTGCASQDMAHWIVANQVIADGYSRPRWWQFWRWFEERLPPVDLNKMPS